MPVAHAAVAALLINAVKLELYAFSTNRVIDPLVLLPSSQL